MLSVDDLLSSHLNKATLNKDGKTFTRKFCLQKSKIHQEYIYLDKEKIQRLSLLIGFGKSSLFKIDSWLIRGIFSNESIV